MNTTPKVSVIIPVYNAEQYLPQTLESILNQSLREIEVICVDDGSTDRSLDILQDYAGRDQRVKVLRQQNLHAGVARNAGLEIAAGEYVHFLDADDYVLDYAYEAIYNKAVKYDLDCLKFASVPYDVQQDLAVENSAYTLSHLRPGDFHRLLTLEAGSAVHKLNVAPWNGIYRRSFLLEKQIRFNDLFCVNDRSFFARVITNAPRIMISRDRLVVHRVSLSESLVGKRAQYFDCHFRSIEIIGQNLVQDQVPDEYAGTIMSKEFGDLLVWLEKFAFDPVYGPQVIEATKQFVKEYDGLYRRELTRQFKARLKRIAAGPRDEKPPVERVFFRKACKAPKVSVVVPIYNVEDYLNEALHSLSEQTLEEMEFLCVNDGSTDGSLTILKEYAAIDGRFRILDGPNGGYGKAMNRGIDAARGEYLGILEPDDYVPAKMFKRLYRIASKNELDFVKADFYRFSINPNGSMNRKLFQLSGDSSYYDRVIRPGSEPAVFKFVMNTWSGIYSLNFLNRWHIRHNETPGASYQDNGFWFQTFCRAERAWFVNKPFYMNRRDNPNSSMFNKSKLYCVTDEYRFIWNWLNQDPALVKQFAPIFYMKQFSNFMVTYRRIADQFRPEYLQHICDIYRPLMESGKLDPEWFDVDLWKELNDILADPVAFYEKIRVSVIIPVYNCENYLRECLDSVLMRNEVRFEVICVDDGSTDSSPEILRAYAEKDPRVTVITQKNAGAGAARNAGLKLARGEYLSFLDADDFFEYDMLRRAYRNAYIYESDIVAFRSDQYVEAEQRKIGAQYTVKTALLPEEQPFAGLDIEENIFGVFVGWAWDKLFRADFVRANHLLFQEQRTTNDMLFVYSAIVRAEKITVLDAVLAHHRRDSGSLSVTREQSWDCFYRALCALRKQLQDWGLYERLEQDFINYSLNFTLWNLTSLRGPAYFMLYDKLRSEWIEDLGINRHPAAYFYNQDEYEKIQSVLTLTAEEFLFGELDEARTARDNLQRESGGLKNTNRKLKKQLEKAAASEEKLHKTIDRLEGKLQKMRGSLSWKIGRMVTWLPRRLKRLLRKK